MFGYIYLTTNTINNKIYIGQHKATQFEPNYKGSGYIIKDAFKKYGKDMFNVTLLEWCEDETALNDREIYWIDYYNSTNPNIGYNISSGGKAIRFEGINHPMYGKHHTTESRQKNSISHKGKKHTDETKQKMSKTQSGKRLSDEHKRKIGDANRGKVHGDRLTDSGRKRISYANKGKTLSEEQIQKLRNIHLGSHLTDETRKHMSLAHLGHEGYWKNKTRDAETKEKIRQTLTGKPNYKKRIKYIIKDKEFDGLLEGANYYNITTSCMSLWIKKGKTKYGEDIKVIISGT